MHNNIIHQEAEGICRKLPMTDLLKDAEVVVTGASGLIGTYILACLARLKDMGINMKLYALCRSEPPQHMAELASNKYLEILRINLSDFEEYRRLPRADIIIHSAGYAQPSLFMADPVASIQINTSATAALLGRLRPAGRFLFVSSSEVYSGLVRDILSEDDIGLTTPSHPRAAYIEGKRCGEAICNAFLSQGMNVRIARVALAYGPGTRRHDKRVMNAIIEKALHKDRIDLMDSGTAIRTYCYVADTVELLLSILLSGRDVTYNVGGRDTLTIAELAMMIGRITGKEVVIPSTESPSAGAPVKVRLDLSKTESEFGKTDFVGLEEGLKRTIQWQQELYCRGQEE